MPKGKSDQVVIILPKSKFTEYGLDNYVSPNKRITEKNIRAHEIAFGEEVVVLKVLP